VQNVSTFLSTKQTNYRIASVLTRAMIGRVRQPCKNRSCDWLNETRSFCVSLSVDIRSEDEDGELVYASGQTELFYHSVSFTCKVGFQSSVIVCSSC